MGAHRFNDALECRCIGLDCETGSGRVHAHDEPRRTVIDATGRRAEIDGAAQCSAQMLCTSRSATRRRAAGGAAKCHAPPACAFSSTRPAPHCSSSLPGTLGPIAAFEQGMRRAQCGMSLERQFASDVKMRTR